MVQASRPRKQSSRVPAPPSTAPCIHHWLVAPVQKGVMVHGQRMLPAHCLKCEGQRMFPTETPWADRGLQQSKYRTPGGATSIGNKAAHEDAVERMRYAKAQANSAIAW